MSNVVTFSGNYVSPVIRELREKRPKFEKGLIISEPMIVQPGMVSPQGPISNEDLRRSVLFWDHLTWPVNIAIGSEGTSETQFLQEVGYLSRPVFSNTSGELSNIIKQSYVDCFQQREAENPGCWALAQGRHGLDFGEEFFTESRGAEVELYQAVPVPRHDVPLQEVLEFKYARHDEVLTFNQEVDGFFESWANAVDREYQLKRAQRRIEKACTDLIAVTNESRHPFKRSNWRITYGLNAIAAYGAYELLEKVPAISAVPFASEAIAATGALIGLSPNFGPKLERVKSSPYRYAVSIDQHL